MLSKHKSTNLLVATILLVLIYFVATNECESIIFSPRANFLKLLKNSDGRKEIATQIKIMFNKVVRDVPLAKQQSQELLGKLFEEKRRLGEQINEWERNLGVVMKNKQRNAVRIVQVEMQHKDYGYLKKDQQISDTMKRVARPHVSMNDLSESVVGNWNLELTRLYRELAEVKRRIALAKKIIKHPESYISIPSNFEKVDSMEVVEREREILIRDRENIALRDAIKRGLYVPFWTKDEW